MKNHCFSRKLQFHTSGYENGPSAMSFIPWAHFSYLGHIFHTLSIFLSIFFIPWYHWYFFIPSTLFSYLWVYFHTFNEYICIPLGCDFIPKLFDFIPLDRFFHTLGIAISYLLQLVSHPEQIYSYPNWTIHSPGWKFTIKLTYGSIGRHKWQTHPPVNRNLVP